MSLSFMLPSSLFGCLVVYSLWSLLLLRRRLSIRLAAQTRDGPVPSHSGLLLEMPGFVFVKLPIWVLSILERPSGLSSMIYALLHKEIVLKWVL